MKDPHKKHISSFFNTAASGLTGLALLFSSGCATVSGNKGAGHQKPRIDEPTLRVTNQSTYQNITHTRAAEQLDEGFLNKFDDLIDPNDNFTVERLDYKGQDGTDNYAELIVPNGQGPYPLIVSFPILDGSDAVTDLMSRRLVRHDFAILSIKSRSLQIGTLKDHQDLIDRYRNTIIDARGLLQYARDLPQIDGNKIGASGISLSAVQSATLIGLDENVKAASIILGGSGFASILYDSGHKEIRKFRDRIIEKHNLNGREEFINFVSQYSDSVDPGRYAGSVEPCRVNMWSAAFDAIIPPANTKALWTQFDKPTWTEVLPSGHMQFATAFYPAMSQTAKHFDFVFSGGCDNPSPVPSSSSFKAAKPFVLGNKLSR